MPSEILDELSKREILTVDGLSGDPFGVAAEGQGEFFILRVHTTGSADLYHAKDGVVTGSLAHAGDTVWRVISGDVAEEFNSRLHSKDRPSGNWPEPGGNVRLHWQFGRELEILMLCASVDWASMRPALEAWKAMDPARRFACWKKWQDTYAGQEWRHNEIVHIFRGETTKERVAAKVNRHKLDILFEYVVGRDVKALDEFFPERAMSSVDRAHSKKLSSYNYAEDVQITLARAKLVKASMQRWAEKRAYWAQMEKEAA